MTPSLSNLVEELRAKIECMPEGSKITLTREAATALLLSALKVGWRDIDSAPKDRFLLLWFPGDQSRWLAKWQGDRWYGVDDEGLTRQSTGWAPTHWQPLPSPPVKL